MQKPTTEEMFKSIFFFFFYFFFIFFLFFLFFLFFFYSSVLVKCVLCERLVNLQWKGFTRESSLRRMAVSKCVRSAGNLHTDCWSILVCRHHTSISQLFRAYNTYANITRIRAENQVFSESNLGYLLQLLYPLSHGFAHVC